MKRIFGWLSSALTGAMVLGMVACTIPFPNEDYTTSMSASALIATNNGSGSGTFITPTKVLTARHVARIFDPRAVTTVDGWVEDIDGKTHKIIGVEYPEKQVDIAIVIVETPLEGHDVAPVSCRVPDVGEELYNIGNPWGVLKWFWAKAWVSGLDSDYKGAKAGPLVAFNGFVWFQGVSIGGQSGSAMFDRGGNIVGVLVQGFGSPERDPGSVDTIGGFTSTGYVCDFIEAATTAREDVIS